MRISAHTDRIDTNRRDRRISTTPQPLFLSLLLAGSLLAAGGAAAADGQARYKGRSVTSVIDEFRAQGFGLAYSTSLVSDDLRVTVEPTSTEGLEIIREILEPHDLTLRSEEGLWLIVGNDFGRQQNGQVLLIVRDKRDYMPLDQPSVSAVPALKPPSMLAPGIQHYTGLEPGTYRIEVLAGGFEPALRLVDVEPSKTTAVTVLLEPAKPEIESITVSASRYQISRDDITPVIFLDRRTIQNMPDIGEDPVRVTQRLPGTAAGGVSARAHFRGGEDSETGIILNGQRLFDPFHVRDYQNIFSAIDSRAIDGVEIYTGGFPARYGDRLSGFVLMNSLDSMRPRHTELGLSVFNTSILSAGTFSGGDSQWLVSARRSNLDIVLDPKLGQPTYYDMFGEISFDLTSNARLSLNGLYADDKVTVVLESEPSELEQAISETQNAQFWIALDNEWGPSLRSKSVLSFSSYSNDRIGESNDMEKIVSDVDDRRRVSQYGFRQDWLWNQSEDHFVQWGFQVEHSDARYSYVAEAEYFGFPALYEDVDDTISRDFGAAPLGNSFAVYISDRWKILPKTIVELGLRWDDQTYTGLVSDTQLSPRLSVLHALSPATELRFSWGRYHQSQGIHELQIEDGVTDFYPAQRADHAIAGLRHKFSKNTTVRVELFHKDMSRLRPRFENLFDPLALIPELQPDRVRIAPSKGRAKGVEFSIDHTSGTLTWWASYTLSEVTDTIDGVEVPRNWDQRHALLAGLHWSNAAWDFSVASNVHTGWPTTGMTLVDAIDPSGEPTFIAIPGPRNAERHGSFASLDARLSRRFKVGKGTITAFIEVSNLLNHHNPCCLDYDLAEDPASNDMLERGEDYWLPRLPAIGILWEFH